MNYDVHGAYLQLCELAEVRPLNTEDLLFEYERAILNGFRARADRLCGQKGPFQ